MADTPSLEELIAGLDASDEQIQDVGDIHDSITEVGNSEPVPEALKEDIIDQVEDIETGSDLDALAEIINAGATDEKSDFVSQLQDDMAMLAGALNTVEDGAPAPGFDPVTGDSNQMIIDIDNEDELPLYGGAEVQMPPGPDDFDYTGRTPQEILEDLQQNVAELVGLLSE